MPRAWNEKEKESIQSALKSSGRRLFEEYGVRKTTIDDIIAQAKISKGAFYLFYPSKEALFFSLLEEIETELKGHLFNKLSNDVLPPQERFRSFLEGLISMLTDEPIFRRLLSGDLDFLIRSLPEADIKAHMLKDQTQLAEYFSSWMEKGWMRPIGAEALVGLLTSLFYFALHRTDFGEEQFQVTRQATINMLCEHLFSHNT